MIIVAEGPSAAGKTTWATSRPTRHLVAETRTVAPAAMSSDAAHAAFWSEVNCRRWAEATHVETSTGLAVCDTDPLKLHYDYCLAVVGAGSWARFDLGVTEAVAAIEQRRLGVADLVVIHLPDDETLTRQRDADVSRRRRHFELHRRLASPLRDWYAVLDRLDPGRVRWTFPDEPPAHVTRSRFDVDLFRSWMAALPRTDDRS